MNERLLREWVKELLAPRVSNKAITEEYMVPEFETTEDMKRFLGDLGPNDATERDVVDPMTGGVWLEAGETPVEAGLVEAPPSDEDAPKIQRWKGEKEDRPPATLVDATKAMSDKITAADESSTIEKQKLAPAKKGPVKTLRLKPALGAGIQPEAFIELVKDVISRAGMEVTKLIKKNRNTGYPSGTYDSLEVTDWADGEKFYVVLVTGRSAGKDKNELDGKMMGIIAEYATIQGLGGTASFAKSIEDSLVKQPFAAMDDEGREMAEGIYNEMVECAQNAQALDDYPGGTAVPGNVTAGSEEGGTTTAAVDVLLQGGVVDADIHVKFNDFDRMMGLQMDPGEKVLMVVDRLEQEHADETWPFAAQYKWLRNQFVKKYLLPLYLDATWEENADAELPEELKVNLLSREKKGEPPKAQSAIGSTIDMPSQFTDDESIELDMFHVPEIREAWLAFARGESVTNTNGVKIKSGKEPLADLIKTRLAKFIKAARADKSVYFFKYGTRPSPPTSTSDVEVYLKVEQFVGIGEDFVEALEVKEEPNASTTFPYVVLYNKKPIWRIETRTSGEGHPPQVKTDIPDEVKQKFIQQVTADNEDNAGVGIETDDTQVDTMIDELTKTFPTIEAGTVAATKTKTTKESRRYLRALIRETLLTEELTKSDRKEIEKITRKQMKRDQIDKKEITKIARQEAEAEIKKSLGASFLGTPGKINKAIQDIAREEMQTALKGKELEKAAADVTKRVLYAFYKMMYNRKNLIDDIKLS